MGKFLVLNADPHRPGQQGKVRVRTTLLVGALLFLVWYLAFPENPAGQIARKTRELCALGTFAGEDQLVERLSWAHEIGAYFTRDFEARLLTMDGIRPLVHDRKELEQRIVAARPRLAELKIEFSDLKIRISGASAEVIGIARAIGRTPGRDDYFEEKHKIKLRLTREGGNWLIERAENLDPIEWTYE